MQSWQSAPAIGSAPAPRQQQPSFGDPIVAPAPPSERRAQRDQQLQEVTTAQSLQVERERLDIARQSEGRQAAQAAQADEIKAKGYDATEGERKAAAFLIRALGSNRTFEGAGVGPRSLVGQMAKDTFPNATNYFTDGARQTAESAQNEFIAATLRQDSGAAIPEAELESQRRIYFPMPGDGEEVLEQKRQARLRAIAGLEQSAGRLLQQTQEEWARMSEDFGPLPGEGLDNVVVTDDSPDDGVLRGRVTDDSPPRPGEPGGGPADPIASSMFGEFGRFMNAFGEVSGEAATLGLADEFAGIGGAIGAALRGEDVSAGFERGRQGQETRSAAAEQYMGGATLPIQLATGGAGGRAVSGIGAGFNAARRIASSGAPVTRQAVQSSLTRRAGASGAAIGGIAGAAQGDTLQERGTNALAGVALGGALGGGGQMIGNRLANRAPSAGAGVQQAADNLGIEVTPAVTGGTATQMLTSGAKQGFISARPIDQAVDRMTDQAMAARGVIADSVGPRLDAEDAGNIIRTAGEVFSQRTSRIGGKLYDRVERLGGGQQFPLTGAVQKADEWLADVGRSVQGKEGTIYKQIASLREQMASGQFDVMSIPRTRDEFRAILQEGNLRGTTLETAVKQILKEGENDILRGLQASGNDRAVGAFKTATEFWQKRVDTIDNFFSPILGKNAPKSGEQVVTALERLANPKTGNASQLVGIMKAMPPREAASVRATLINRMGRATAGSANDTDVPTFSFDTFMTNWNNMSPRAKAAVFPPETRQAMNDLKTVAKAVKDAGSSANRSNTAGALTAQAAISGSVGWFLHPLAAVGLGGGQYAAGRLLASPKFARLLAGAPRQGTPQARQALSNRLGNLAQAEPTMAREIGLYQRALTANDNNAVRAVAAEDENQQPR